MIFFHISAKNIDCGYSLELPRWGSSNEYPKYMVLSRSKNDNIYSCKPQFYYITRAGVCKTLCPQLPDSNTARLQHCLPMTVTTVQIYEISMLFYQREITLKQEIIGIRKKYGSPIFSWGIKIQLTLVISTPLISILSLMSNWFLNPDYFPYVFIVFQRRVCRTTFMSTLRLSRPSFSVPEYIFHSFYYRVSRTRTRKKEKKK